MKKRVKRSVLQRRFKRRKEPAAESVDVSGLSRYTGLSASKYFDSDTWAHFEQNLPDYTRSFYSVAGANKYCYEALDKKIDMFFQDELQHYTDQYERHCEVIESIFAGVDREVVTVNERLLQVDERIKELKNVLAAKQAVYDSYNRKVESK